MRTVFFGTPAFAVPSLRSLIASGTEVAAVVTQPDKRKGRGHALSQPPVKEFALTSGIPVLQPLSVRTGEFLDELKTLKPDVITVVAYGRILPKAILELPRLGCVNVHGSLLPKYRGAAPVQWSIINGDEKTGITTMLMNEGLDTGDMLLMEETLITPEDTADSLSVRLSTIGADLLVKTLAGLENDTIRGAIRPVPQTGEPSFAPPLRKEDGKINWLSPAVSIFNLVRGMWPWPGAFCMFNGERITVIKAAVSDDAGQNLNSQIPGSIAGIRGGGLLVRTGDGVLAISELKPEGKKAMAALDFANGRHLREGMRFDVL